MMSFQWLQMRISEENDRRKKETNTLARLPSALEEVHEALQVCVQQYRDAFGEEAAELQLDPPRIKVIARQEASEGWKQNSTVEVLLVPILPGFQIDNGSGGDPWIVEVGVLPGEKLYYRDREKDQYITMEDLTKRIVDRAFFPKLPE